MLRIGYAMVVLLYVGVIVIWFLRFPISYRLTNGINHELVVDHDFTDAEIVGVEKAFSIRQTISAVLLYNSIVLSVGSFLILQNASFVPRRAIKTVILISGIVAFILILVDGIHFIPTGPIR